LTLSGEKLAVPLSSKDGYFIAHHSP
jgi:hypothetical protein